MLQDFMQFNSGYNALSIKELLECSVKFALRAKKPNAI